MVGSSNVRACMRMRAKVWCAGGGACVMCV